MQDVEYCARHGWHDQSSFRARRRAGIRSGGRRVIAALRHGLLVAACATLVACTPAGQLMYAVLPDGTIPILLSHLQRESDTQQKRVAELERKADWPGLVKLAEENIAKEPANASWWLVAGYSNSRQKNHQRAMDCFREMVRLEPDAAEGWNLLGQEHRMAGDSRRAVAVLTQALSALRDSALTLLLLGESYSDLGQFDLALRPYRQALDIDAGLTLAWVGLARAHIKRGQWAQAESIVRSLEKTHPQLASALSSELAAQMKVP